MSFSSQGAIGLIHHGSHFVSGDGVSRSIGVFGEEFASNVKIVLGDAGILAFLLADYGGFVVLFARHMLLCLSHSRESLGVDVWVWIDVLVATIWLSSTIN